MRYASVGVNIYFVGAFTVLEGVDPWINALSCGVTCDGMNGRGVRDRRAVRRTQVSWGCSGLRLSKAMTETP